MTWLLINDAGHGLKVSVNCRIMPVQPAPVSNIPWPHPPSVAPAFSCSISFFMLQFISRQTAFR